MAVVIDKRTGQVKTLLSPKQKGKKYAGELRTGIRTTNDGRYKADKNGDVGLSRGQRSYRAGYLDARKDIGKAAAYMKNKHKR